MYCNLLPCSCILFMLSRAFRLTNLWKVVLIFFTFAVIRKLVVNYVHFEGLKEKEITKMFFEIGTTWNDQPIDHEPIKISLESDNSNIIMRVDASFFNDPGIPDGPPGQPFPALWDYEVVEAFFLNDYNDYLEVELCPHGQHLLLLLHGVRNSFKDKLPLVFNSTINGNKWTGKAVIPGNFFPPKVTKFNAYAIHGSGNSRIYESLYPVPASKYTDPDFHRLQFFKSIDFRTLFSWNWSLEYQSKEWEQYYSSNSS